MQGCPPGWALAPALLTLFACSSTPAEPERHGIDDFPRRRAVTQETPVWCWAACTEMVLAHYDVEETQHDIAERIHGRDPDDALRVEAASRYEIACALAEVTGDARIPFDQVWQGFVESLDELDPNCLDDLDVDVDERSAGTAATTRWLSVPTLALADLRGLDSHPAVVGLLDAPDEDLGHAYVLYAARIDPLVESGLWNSIQEAGSKALGESHPKEAVHLREALANPLATRLLPPDAKIREVDLIDPYTGETVTLEGDDFNARVHFVLTREAAVEQIETWKGLVAVEGR